MRAPVLALTLVVSLWLPHGSQNIGSLLPATTCRLPRDLTSLVWLRELAEKRKAVKLLHKDLQCLAEICILFHILSFYNYTAIYLDDKQFCEDLRDLLKNITLFLPPSKEKKPSQSCKRWMEQNLFHRWKFSSLSFIQACEMKEKCDFVVKWIHELPLSGEECTPGYTHGFHKGKQHDKCEPSQQGEGLV